MTSGGGIHNSLECLLNLGMGCHLGIEEMEANGIYDKNCLTGFSRNVAALQL